MTVSLMSILVKCGVEEDLTRMVFQLEQEVMMIMKILMKHLEKEHGMMQLECLQQHLVKQLFVKQAGNFFGLPLFLF